MHNCPQNYVCSDWRWSQINWTSKLRLMETTRIFVLVAAVKLGSSPSEYSQEWKNGCVETLTAWRSGRGNWWGETHEIVIRKRSFGTKIEANLIRSLELYPVSLDIEKVWRLFWIQSNEQNTKWSYKLWSNLFKIVSLERMAYSLSQQVMDPFLYWEWVQKCQ